MRIIHWFFCAVLVTACHSTTGQTVGLLEASPYSQPGYNLWSNGVTTHLVDNCGRRIHDWIHDGYPGGGMYMLPSGDLLRTKRLQSELCAGCSQGGGIEQIAPDGTVVWFGDFTGPDHHAHHDIEPLPNGNILVLLWERITEAEALTLGRSPELLPPTGDLYVEMLWEVQPGPNDTFEVVWEWHQIDHVMQAVDPSLPNYGTPAELPQKLDINAGPTSADWLHANSVDYHPDRDEIVLSLRYINEVVIIDHNTTTEEAAGPAGDYLWRWGNPANLGSAEPAQLAEQHDAQWILEGYPGAGHLTIFDNNLTGTSSQVEEVLPATDAEGNYILDAPQADQRVWSWEHPDLFSSFISGCERQPNGNTLICEGDDGLFWEVNPEGEVLWKYRNPVYPTGDYVEQGTEPPVVGALAISVFRMHRILLDFPGLSAFDLEPGEPLEVNPLPIPDNCEPLPESVGELGRTPALCPNPASTDHVFQVPSGVQAWSWNYADGRRLADAHPHSLKAPAHPGMYLLRLETSTGVHVQRMLIQ